VTVCSASTTLPVGVNYFCRLRGSEIRIEDGDACVACGRRLRRPKRGGKRASSTVTRSPDRSGAFSTPLAGCTGPLEVGRTAHRAGAQRDRSRPRTRSEHRRRGPARFRTADAREFLRNLVAEDPVAAAGYVTAVQCDRDASDQCRETAPVARAARRIRARPSVNAHPDVVHARDSAAYRLAWRNTIIPTAAACARRAFRGTRVVARRNALSGSSSITPSGPARPFRLARVPRPGMTNTNVRLGTHRPHSDVRSADRAQLQHQSLPDSRGTVFQ